MMNPIDDNLLLKLERLAKLNLDPDERAVIKTDLNKILAMFEKLQELDTTTEEPFRYFSEINQENVRQDAVKEHLQRETILGLAPKHDDSFIRIPKMKD
ncbi:MAG TPA: Asp-tRNA(Asn)/Glu-tRNA(Gln) amidotransferase subunit GatC [Saprospiraceae bacterium]|nr:Asp-tRNA(Asn)/Glu-tRNA(Gln) amidotransferase subunit GatC [Saprospiraceae bacterium]